MRNRGSGSNELEVPDIGQSEFGTVSISHVYNFVYFPVWYHFLESYLMSLELN